MAISNTRFTSKSSILLHWSLGSMRSIRLFFKYNFHACKIKKKLSPIQIDHIIVIVFCKHQLVNALKSPILYIIIPLPFQQ
jgi:hypothetical protein